MGDHSEQIRRFHTLIKLAGEVLSETSPERILCRAAESARELTGSGVGLCAPMSRDGRFLEGGGVSIFGGKALFLDRERFRAGQYMCSLIGRLTAQVTVRWPEEELAVLQAERDRTPAGHPAIRGLLGARLDDGNGLCSGAILLSCKNAGDFTAEDEEVLAQFSSLVSPCIRQAAARKEMLALQERLLRGQEELEAIISRRTTALSKMNRALKEEVLERKKNQERIKSYHEQLRYMASELSLSEERERRRIAVAVHDHVSQNLAAAKLKLETLRAEASPDVAGPLKDIQGFIESSIQDARSIVMELSPPILYELGLLSALEWLAESMQSKHGIDIDFEGDGPPPSDLDRNIQVLLFQVTRELLWNVVKHAKARHVRVFFRSLHPAKPKEGPAGGGKIQIRVEDDGVGFDPAGLGGCRKRESGGFGIFSIRERLRPLGGSMLMESAPGKGTRAVIELEFGSEPIPRSLLRGKRANHV